LNPIPIKICGLTRAEDALLAWELGASALGFIFHSKSPRYVTPEQVVEIRRQLPAEAFCVGVFVDRTTGDVNAIAEAAGLDAVQLHGRETPLQCAAMTRPVIKVIRAEDEHHLDEYAVAAFLLDAAHPTLAGGTGLTADWSLAARIARRVPLILAGGLEPANIREAIRAARPAGLDLSSGVEAAPGVKDAAKMNALFSSFDFQGARPCLIPR
jgi:phosphoribosylanthranilate isomerase